MKKKEFFALFFILAGYILFLYITKIGCPIRFLTGISCMGCGLTRACVSLLKGNLLEALVFHPLVLLLPIIGILFYRELTHKEKRIDKILWSIIIILFVLVYLIRLACKSEVVQININEGVIYKIVAYLRQGENIW